MQSIDNLQCRLALPDSWCRVMRSHELGSENWGVGQRELIKTKILEFIFEESLGSARIYGGLRVGDEVFARISGGILRAHKFR